MSKVLCRSCDLVVDLPEYQRGIQCVCPRCGALLRPAFIENERVLAIVALSTLLFGGTCIFLPYLEISSYGVYSSLKLIDIFTILDYQWAGLLYIFLLVTFFSPLILLSIIAFFGIFTKIRPPVILARIYQVSHSLCMVDVFIMGILVSLIKLSSLASVEFYAGFYLSFLFSILLLWLCIRCRPEWFWNRVIKFDIKKAEAGINGSKQKLFLCRCCGMAFSSDINGSKCPRCRKVTYNRQKNCFQRTFALLVAALILYLPSNLYPVMYTELLFSNTGSNIIDGVIAMWNMKSYFVAIVILLASIFIPIFKILILCFILFAVKSNKVCNSKLLTILYRIVHFIGRWSMIDVFVVIIMSSVVRLSGLLTIYPGFAIICFCSVVFITIFAVDAFDERLIWDHENNG